MPSTRKIWPMVLMVILALYLVQNPEGAAHSVTRVMDSFATFSASLG
jgi:hypothetical protein